MTIQQASNAIAQAVASGQIDRQTAARALDAIRGRSYYGQCLTNRDRASILRNRFGIEVVL